MLFIALRSRLHLNLVHGRGVGQLSEFVHRHRSSAAQLFCSILIDQDHQELTRFDIEVVPHSCQLIFAKAGSVDPGARNGLVMTLRNDRDVQQVAAPEIGGVGLRAEVVGDDVGPGATPRQAEVDGAVEAAE